MGKELSEFGYLKENLFDKRFRVRKIAQKVYRQTLLPPKYSYPEYDIQHNVPVYITPKLAEFFPDYIFLKVTYDDIRFIYAKDEDVFSENQKPLLIAMGKGYADLTIPHLIFELELER